MTESAQSVIAAPPSADQWKCIEEYLRTGFFANVVFQVQGYKISVQKRFIAENKMGLLVYIDDVIAYGAIFPDGEKHKPIHQLVWRRSVRSVFSRAKKARLEKSFGKRKAREYFPSLDKQLVYFHPDFSTAKSLVRQFRKIEDLQLVEMGCDSKA